MKAIFIPENKECVIKSLRNGRAHILLKPTKNFRTWYLVWVDVADLVIV